MVTKKKLVEKFKMRIESSKNIYESILENINENNLWENFVFFIEFENKKANDFNKLSKEITNNLSKEIEENILGFNINEKLKNVEQVEIKSKNKLDKKIKIKSGNLKGELIKILGTTKDILGSENIIELMTKENKCVKEAFERENYTALDKPFYVGKIKNKKYVISEQDLGVKIGE